MKKLTTKIDGDFKIDKKYELEYDLNNLFHPRDIYSNSGSSPYKLNNNYQYFAKYGHRPSGIVVSLYAYHPFDDNNFLEKLNEDAFIELRSLVYFSPRYKELISSRDIYRDNLLGFKEWKDRKTKEKSI